MTSTQKVAIVTGASSGIGKASALALMKEGYAVVFAGRRKDMLESAAAEGQGTPGKSLVVQTDVTSHESIKALFAKTKETFGRLDVLFNNAGGGAPPVLLEDLTYEQWTTVVNANLTGVFLCTQEAFKIMKAQTPDGRAHHQQRVDLGAHAAAQLLALHRDQARGDRPHQGHRARRPQVRYRVRADRHRQRGHSDDRAHGEGRAPARRHAPGRSRPWT